MNHPSSSPALLSLLCLLACLRLPTAAAEDPAILKREFIYTEAPFKSCHASTIAETPTGLVTAWFGGTDEGNDDVAIWVSRFTGEYWTPPYEAANGVQDDGRRHPCWNPVLFQAPDGPLILFYKVGPSPSKWWGMQMESTDGGASWSKGRKLPDGILGPVRNKPVLLADGDLVAPSSSEHDGWKIHVERTSDLGKTWTRTEPLNDGKAYGAIQPTLLTWSPKVMQMLCRTKGGERISEVWSRDKGLTWGEMRLTSLPNPNAGIDAVMLRAGGALLVYNHTTRGRSPLNLALTREGRQFHAALVLERDKGEYSYPAIIQSNDGLVHITYTWKRERIRHLVVDPKQLQPRPILGGAWAAQPSN